MTQQPAPRVFISYSHDSLAHAARVLKFANDLRRDGVDATIDQYFTSPPEGWPAWMDRHIRDDDFVVMVCTETYYRRVVRKEAPGIGLGVRWEGSLIYNHLYKSDLSRFVPVLLNGGKLDYIPESVAGATQYPVDTPGGYEGLLRRLFNQPAAEMPVIGKRPALAVFPMASPLAALHNVPGLPPHFLPRPDAFDGLKRKLLGSNGGAVAVTGVATRIGVQGMGGIGKSVLTAAVVRDDEVRSAFPAGIFWISLGQMPNVLTRQADLYWLLTREKGGFADTQQGRIALQEALRGRNCLVILDDVWQLTAAEAFNVVDADARLLLTTRDAAIVKGMGAREHEVDHLDRPASLRLLAQTSNIAVESLPAEADAIAKECGDLPLALALAGGMIEGRADMWSLVLKALLSAAWEQINRDFADYPYPGIFATIEASVNALGAERERYLDLAIFPEDVPLPEAALKALWTDLRPLQVRKLVTRFRDRSLARLDADNRLTLHDLQRDFVRKRASDLSARHARLIEAYRSHCPNGWASGPDDGYFFRHLLLHLAQAGHHDELKTLLADYAWIEAKLKASDVQSVISDYNLVANEPDLSLVQRALRLSIPALSRDWTHLPGQLIGRLREIDEPRVQALLEQANAGPGTAWLCPQTASLRPPGTLLQTFAGHAGPVWALAVLPDGRALSGSSDHTMRLWDLASGQSSVLEGHAGPVWALAVLPDGRALSGSSDHTMRLWDLASGQSSVLEGHAGPVWALAVLPDGRVLSGSWDHTLRLWDLASGQSRVLEGHAGPVWALAVLPDGRVLSGGDWRGFSLQWWDLASGEGRVLKGHTNIVTALAVLPDGRVLSSSWDHTLRLWDLAGGESRVLSHTDRITALAVLPDGRVLSSSWDHTLRLWDLAGGESRVLSHTDPVTALAVLPDGRALSGGDWHGTLQLWDLATGESRVLAGHTDPVTALAVLPDGRALSSSWDHTLQLWNLASGESRVLAGHTGPVTALAVLPDGRVLSGSADRTLRLWDLARGKSRVLEGHTGRVTALAVLPDGRALSGSADCSVIVWDVARAAPLAAFVGDAQMNCVAATPSHLLAGADNGAVHLLRLRSLTPRFLDRFNSIAS